VSWPRLITTATRPSGRQRPFVWSATSPSEKQKASTYAARGGVAMAHLCGGSKVTKENHKGESRSWPKNSKPLRENLSRKPSVWQNEVEKPLTQIARDLGIADSTLSHWRKQLREEGGQAFPGSGHQPPLEEENRRLRRENEVLRQERDILKKAVSIFSHPLAVRVPVHCGPSGRVSGRTHV
jgi:transposase